MAATSDGSAALAGSLGLGLLSFSIMQPIQKMAKHIQQYREAAMTPKPITRVTTNKVAAYTLVHCAESMAQAEENGIWDSVWWWYKNLAEFTIEWELPHMSKEEHDAIFPLLRMQAEDGLDPKVFNDADMIIVGDPEQCLEKMLKYQELGVDQLICYVQFGHLLARVGDEEHRAARQGDHPRAGQARGRGRSPGVPVHATPSPDYLEKASGIID